MTDPNDATTPLSRMRFSWQRGQGSGVPATDSPSAPEQESPPAGEGVWVPDGWEQQQSPEQAPSPPQPQEQQPPRQAPRHAQQVPPDQPATRRSAIRPAAPPEPGYSEPQPQAGYPEPPAGYAQTAPPPAAQPAAQPVAQPYSQASAPPVPPPAAPSAPAEQPVYRAGTSQPGAADGYAYAGQQAAPAYDDAVRFEEGDFGSARPEPPRSRQAKPSQSRSSSSRGRKTKRDRFDVPPPGGRFSGGRGTHAFVRATVVVTTCLLALGIVGYVAFSFGALAVQDNTYSLNPKDIERYRLTEFPLAQAGQFASDYTRICLTHNPAPGAPEQREARLEHYVSEGVDSACGWNGKGEQTVQDATWTGESEPVDVGGYQGHTRAMTVRVLTSTGSRIVTVPVYVANLATGEGMRIVGDVGEVPQPSLARAPKPQPGAASDNALANALRDGEFFAQFFTAWGDSSSASLQRLVTTDATVAATGGLAGSLNEPQIDRVQVFFPSGVTESDQDFTWKRGAVTEAWVWVTWHNPSAGADAQETRAYRLQLVKQTEGKDPAQEWAVRDIRGGVPDLGGG
ncbi:conjugal transfer protein [Flindersiella endophytica]